MEKNLNEILKRDDYKKLTKQLKERVEKIACSIAVKMFDLDIEREIIKIDDVHVTCDRVRSNGGGVYDFLAIGREDGYGYGTDWYSLEDVNHSYYYCGDYDARVCGCTNKEALCFLNVASKIIERLDDIERAQVKEIQKALDNTKDL